MKIPFLTKEFAGEFRIRLEKIRDAMRQDKLDAILIADNANLYYSSGCMFRGYVYIPLQDEKEPLFFVIRPQTVEGDNTVISIRKPEQIADILSKKGYGFAERLGLELDFLSYNETERLKKAFPGFGFGDSSRTLRNARMVKTNYEISEMRKDGLHQVSVYRNVPRLYREDMTDLELQIEIERALRREGCLGYLRTSGHLMEINMGSVICGQNADNPTPYDFAMGGSGVDASLPVGADGAIMHPGTTVMIDMNGSFNGYQTDMTRTWAIGEVPDIARKAHDCSISILRALENLARPGVEVRELYDKAVEIASSHSLADYFMGHSQKAGFIGHGVGIQLNEQPAVTPKNHLLLRENMTLALEPKFVIPDVGAVGVENTYRVTNEGLECLTVLNEELGELR